MTREGSTESDFALDDWQDKLACPVCSEVLHRTDRTMGCDQGHRFDIARQGYVNLLRGKAPAAADTAEMVNSRDRFLSSGQYQPIASLIVEQVDAAIAPEVHSRDATGSDLFAIEVGAGTGYYLKHLLTAWNGVEQHGCDEDGVASDRRSESANSHRAMRGLGTDISVAAAKRMARGVPPVAAVVADTWQSLPLRDDSCDVVLCVFAPRNVEEFARVLRPGAVVAVVTPAADHLASVRERHALMSIEGDKRTRLLEQFSSHFEHVRHAALSYDVELSVEQTYDVIAMGPNGHHEVPRPVQGIETFVSITTDIFRLLPHGSR